VVVGGRSNEGGPIGLKPSADAHVLAFVAAHYLIIMDFWTGLFTDVVR
jgi:hypothetical protein